MNEIEAYKKWLQDHTYGVEGKNKYVNPACLLFEKFTFEEKMV